MIRVSIHEKTLLIPLKRDVLRGADARQVLQQVAHALQSRGYRPVDQIVGYLMSGDPAYITSYGGARHLIKRFERDELLAAMVRHYLK